MENVEFGYGSGCYRGLGCDGMITKALNYVESGFKSIKMFHIASRMMKM